MAGESTGASRPIAEDLLEETAEGLRLVAGRAKASGKLVFPLPGGAERARYDRVLLSPRGTLWSWTVQRFRPKSPPYAGPEDAAGFQPYAVGYVELPCEIIVETRLVTKDFDALAIGMPCELVREPFAGAHTYAFRPIAGAAP